MPEQGPTLEVTQGLARDFRLRIKAYGGVDYELGVNGSPFLSADALAAKVWAGGSLATAATPAATWVDASGDATFQLSLTAAATAALDPGVYQFLVTVTRGGTVGEVARGRLRVLAAPGTGTQALAFTTRDDLLEYAPWLEEVQADPEGAGLGRAQRRATTRLIDAIVNMWKPTAWRPQMGQPGFMTRSLFGSTGDPPPDQWLRQQLVPLAPNSTPDATYPYRLTSPPNFCRPTVSTALLLYDGVIEILAKWAIYAVCDSQLGRAMDESYWGIARRFRAEADAQFRATRFEIDFSNPQTGYASRAVDGGSGSLR